MTHLDFQQFPTYYLTDRRKLLHFHYLVPRHRQLDPIGFFAFSLPWLCHKSEMGPTFWYLQSFGLEDEPSIILESSFRIQSHAVAHAFAQRRSGRLRRDLPLSGVRSKAYRRWDPCKDLVIFLAKI